MVRTTVLALAALSAITASAHAEVFYRYDFTHGQHGTNEGAGRIQSIRAEFNPTTNRFLWDVTMNTSVGGQTVGYWLAISPGPNPKGHAGELALIYFDASNIVDETSVTPRVTVYNYNGINGASSYMDGSPAAGVQAPDRIWSSLNTAGTSPVTQMYASDSGTTRRFYLEMDASIIQNHVPLYPSPEGDEWTGVAFAEKIGVWFHPVRGLNAQYGTDPSLASYNWLTNWTIQGQSWLDGTNFSTQLIPAPGSIALLAVGGLVGLRRRR